MDNLNIKINGVAYTAPAGSTILQACRLNGITIPTLCYLKEINEIGACRICVVEASEKRGNAMGPKRVVASCVYPITEGMEISTNSPKVLDSRKKTLQLILSTHDQKCLSCVRSGNCELQELCHDMGVDNEGYYEGENPSFELDFSAAHMVRDNNKCILCRRCVAACEKTQAVGVIGANERGFATHISSAFEAGLGETSCVSCGQCIAVCPVGAIYEKDCTNDVFNAIADPDKYVVVQPAPAVRATLGEEFGMEMGTNVHGKLAASLRRLGFDKVFDTNFAADLTIMEEATELVERITNKGVLPMITSCSPGWIKYCEHYFPDMTENLSSCKSPHQMEGAMIKTYFAQKNNIDPKKIVVVSVMPCTAKKFEIGRDGENAAGVPDVDYVLTVRELARMIKRAGIRFNELPDEEFDSPLGEGSGAAVIFGATGGVMEAALRTAVEVITGQQLGKLDFTDVRGIAGIKEASYKVGDLDVKVAVASGLKNAKELLTKVKNGEADYTFIEIMGCPGGCVNGGGNPQVHASVRNFADIREIRAKALYNQDANSANRKSHENSDVKKLYAEFLEKPGSHKAHELLHTHYVKRGLYKDILG